MNRGTWIGLGLGALALAIGAGIFRAFVPTPPAQTSSAPPRSLAPTPQVAGAPVAAGQPSGSSSAATAAATNQAMEAGVVAGGATGKTEVPGPSSGIPVGRAGAPSLDDIQRRLLALTAQGRAVSPKEVDAVLADLQRNQGKNVVAGVDIGALRDNLARAERMQQLAQEMQAIAANPKKEDQARLQALMAEIQRLQAGMSTQVYVGSDAAAKK